MKRLKTFATYILVIILFFVFSNIMIFIGLHSTYGNIDLKGELPQGVSISSAKASSVDGKLTGTVSESINSKYIKFDFYDDDNFLAGSYYISPSELENNNFKFYFKLNYIDSYAVELTDEKIEINNFDTFSSEKFKESVIITALIMLIFM